MELVRRAPTQIEDLQRLSVMTPKQIHRHAHGVLHAIQEGLHAPSQRAPQADPESENVRDRYDRLHTWRKKRARARGVESDVILTRKGALGSRSSPPVHPRRTGAHHGPRPLAAANVRGRDSGTAISRHPLAGLHLRRISAIAAAAATMKDPAQAGSTR